VSTIISVPKATEGRLYAIAGSTGNPQPVQELSILPVRSFKKFDNLRVL